MARSRSHRLGPRGRRSFVGYGSYLHFERVKVVAEIAARSFTLSCRGMYQAAFLNRLDLEKWTLSPQQAHPTGAYENAHGGGEVEGHPSAVHNPFARQWELALACN